MQKKTRNILWEIGILFILTLFIYTRAFVLYMYLSDRYNLDEKVFWFSIVFLIFWSFVVYWLPIKNVYIKIAMLYPAILFFLCVWGQLVFLMLVLVP
jgi:hypothetical protein